MHAIQYLAVAGLGLLVLMWFGPPAQAQVLIPGKNYEWVHPKRAGLEAWQYYVVCDDARAAQAFTDELLASIEAFEQSQGHALGAHLELVFPTHLACGRLDKVVFTPIAEPEVAPLDTLDFAMVYLPSAQAERATHRCDERPCAFGPVVRQFIPVRYERDGNFANGWLRVGRQTKVTPAGE